MRLSYICGLRDKGWPCAMGTIIGWSNQPRAGISFQHNVCSGNSSLTDLRWRRPTKALRVIVNLHLQFALDDLHG